MFDPQNDGPKLWMAVLAMEARVHDLRNAVKSGNMAAEEGFAQVIDEIRSLNKSCELLPEYEHGFAPILFS